MTDRRQLAFARVASNLILGGSACAALVTLMRLWINDRERDGRERG